MNRFYAVISTIILTSCGSPSKPIIQYASENSIAIKYHAYDYVPTLTAEAIDIAIKHCNKHGKGMRFVSSNNADGFTTAEIHTFMCTNDFTDKRIEVREEQKESVLGEEGPTPQRQSAFDRVQGHDRLGDMLMALGQGMNWEPSPDPFAGQRAFGNALQDVYNAWDTD